MWRDRSPFLFNIVLDVGETPRDMVYAVRRKEKCRLDLETRGTKITKDKEYDIYREQKQGRYESIWLDGVELKRTDGLKYLGTILSADGSEVRKISGKIQTGWRSLRDVSGVLCGMKMLVMLKGKSYKLVEDFR